MVAHEGERKPPIALLTDFGYRDHYVGVMKGVIASIASAASVIDLTHGIAPQAIAAGALVLAQSWRYFPPRTIFVAVVDPGVGTGRRPIAVETTAGARFIGPDNGLLSSAVNQAGLGRVVELKTPRYRLAEVSATFHGRDIFAPAAAHLWCGVRMAALGPGLRTMTPAPDSPGVKEGRNELAGSILIAGLLFNVQPTDPFTFATVSGFLMIVALLAGLVPAGRAASVDPMVTLHNE